MKMKLKLGIVFRGRKNNAVSVVFSCVCIDKPDSVLQKAGMIIYLDSVSPQNSLRHECSKANSTLHVGKGLAVSLDMLPYQFTPEGCHHLSDSASLLAPRVLPRTGVTCYHF